MATDPHTPAAPVPRLASWPVFSLLLAILTTGNIYLGALTNPEFCFQKYDGPQYHLLVRNRLAGRYHLSEAAHTVRDEGLHPFWRPGIVWIEEFLAPRVGSVQLAAGIAVALGTSFMQIATVLLAGVAFGRWVALGTLLALFSWTTIGQLCLFAVVGYGPEPWSGGFIAFGLALLILSVERRTMGLGLVAGMAAGGAEWFRSGNHLLFGIPCFVYLCFALRGRDLHAAAISVLAGLSYLAVDASVSLVVPATVNKTVANFQHVIYEFSGLTEFDDKSGTSMLGGLFLHPGSNEVLYDYVVPRLSSVSAVDFFRENASTIANIYRQRLLDALASGFGGFRVVMGNIATLLFLVQTIHVVWRSQGANRHTLALALGAWLHYLGPMILLRGVFASHYLIVMMPLVLVVAVHGAFWLGSLVLARVPPARHPAACFVGGLLAILPLVGAIKFYAQFYADEMSPRYADSQRAFEQLDPLHLDGKRVVCRSMVWFLDRNVITVQLPYASASELADYVIAQKADGILLWEGEKTHLFWASPEGSLQDLERALKQQATFGEPQRSGAWVWFPVQ